MTSDLTDSWNQSGYTTSPDVLSTTTEVDLNTSDDGLETERIISIVVPAVFGVIFLLGLAGNTLVILVVVLDKTMRNTTNILILMLALADLLFIICCVPFSAVTYSSPVWPFGRIWCKVERYISYVCAYASVYTLVLMSLDRYLAVVHALRSVNIRTEGNTWLAVAVTWCLILLGNVPLLLQFDVKTYMFGGQQRARCTNIYNFEHPYMGIVFHACFITFGYLLPLGAMCLMYGLMLRRLYGFSSGGTASHESTRSKRRVTKMVMVVVVVFAVCWLPVQVVFLSHKLGLYPITTPYVVLQVAANCLSYMNSCVNPFLYAFLSRNFRQSFKHFLCR